MFHDLEKSYLVECFSLPDTLFLSLRFACFQKLPDSRIGGQPGRGLFYLRGERIDACTGFHQAGDDIQAIKAGILEIADILAVNKADLPGSENAARALRMMLEMAHGQGSLPLAGKHFRSGFHAQTALPQTSEQLWEPPVQLVTATDGNGVPELAEAIQSHKTYLQTTGLWQVKEAFRLQKDLESLVRDTLMDRWREKLDDDRFTQVLADLVQHKLSPGEALQLLL